MIGNTTGLAQYAPAVIVIAAVGLGLLLFLVLGGKGDKLNARIDSLSGRGRPEERPETVASLARKALPSMGRVIVPEDEAERTRLRARLVHAGLYQRQAMYAFLGVKFVLILTATLVGLGLTLTKILPTARALPLSLGLFFVGMFGPGYWLQRLKNARQAALRRGLPDALDVLTICLEGGLSFQGAIKRVADELRSAHPVLGAELGIVDREIQLGRAPGEALGNLARRSDMEEILSLASVITQSERFGAGLVSSLRNHSETLRERRKQKAEEKAQQAATKILIPTLLFIFPAIFVILLAPAAIQVQEIFATSGAPK